MTREESIYRDLQKHLNRQAVGFPATKSGVEIRLLKWFFSPEQARLAMRLSYEPRSIKEIFETSGANDESLINYENIYNRMAKNGVIGRAEREKTYYFYLIPFVVGMYEGQLKKITPEFLADVAEYTASKPYGLELLSTRLPQMRTIPVEESISVDHHITTYDNLKEIIENAKGPIGIAECICRKRAKIKGKSCLKTDRLETCMVFGDMAALWNDAGFSRQINKDEALEIAQQNQADGLVLQPSNSQQVEFICACCGCCCGMLGMQKRLPKPVDFWTTNYNAAVDRDACTGCGICIERCQVNAVKIDEKTGVSTINLDRCIGCGNCVVTCPSQALSLVKREKQTIPPVDSESLYKTIAENKPGILEKLKLMTRLIMKK